MGGNVFKNSSSIRAENISPTLESYFTMLKILFPKKIEIFNLEHFVLLGSACKKSESGDIDLGIDPESLYGEGKDEDIEKWGINPLDVYSEFKKLEKRAKTSTVNQLWTKAFLKVLGTHINNNLWTNIGCDIKGITPGNMFTLYPQHDFLGFTRDESVQIDWMVGNKEWLKFSYYSEAYPKDSNVKGLHRTQLLLACFQVANMSFNHTHGVKCKTNNEILATTPTAALYELSKFYDINFTRANTNSYYSLYDLLRYELSPIVYGAIIDEFLKILDSTRCDIPSNLQTYWLSKKRELGLTGKFIPNESRLKEYL